MKSLSLTWRLFLSLTGLILITLLVVALFGLRIANKEITEDYDAQLITESQVLWQVTQEDLAEGDFKEYDIDAAQAVLPAEYRVELAQYIQWRAFRIWKNGKVVLRSDNAANMPDIPAETGFHDFKMKNEKWRVFALHVPNQIIVESFEDLTNRRILQQDILAGIAVPSLLMLPILALLLFLGIRYGLQQLYHFAQTVNKRSSTDLSKIFIQNISSELRPLVKSINGLLNKLEDSLTREREFTDHAAHELRTPLTTLKLQAQLVAKNSNAADREPIDELLLTVDRTTKLVDQLLLLARLPQAGNQLAAVNLFEAVQIVSANYALHVLDKKISLSLQGDENLQIYAQGDLLHILIKTLLDNAIKYTPVAGEISIMIEDLGKIVLLSIQDTGPGIAEIEQVQVFNRFYRSTNATEPGSGLGLAIAQQIAELHHTKISLHNRENSSGLSVQIKFIKIINNFS